MHKIVLLIAMSLFLDVAAQGVRENVTLNVGDSISLDSCPHGGGFKSIDYYKKTGFPVVADTAGYQKYVGEQFYDLFFTNGDFDAKVLPCEFGGKAYRIIGLKVFQDKKTKEDIRVIFLELGKNMVAWVNLDLASESGEIYLQ